MIVDLLPYRNLSLLFRFRLGTDQVGSAAGWWIDDISFTFTQTSCYTPTVTSTPTSIQPTGTPTSIPPTAPKGAKLPM